MVKRYVNLCIFLTLFCVVKSFAARDKMSVVLDWFANPDHAPIIVAKEHGFFAKENLDVTILQPSDPADPPKWLAAGEVDVAVEYHMHYLQAVQQGMPLVRIGTLVDHPLNTLTVLKSSGIWNVSQLKGKRIGVATSAADTDIVKAMLGKQGVPLDKVELITVRFNLMQALLTGQVDAVVGMMRNYELIDLQMMKKPGRAFYPEHNGVPNYSEMILVTRKNLQKDPRIKRFMHALTKATAYAKAHPKESWQEFIKAYPEQNNELNKKAWFATLPHFTDAPAKALPWQNKQVIKFLINQQVNDKSV